jgi:hypothetical protein
MKKPRKGTAKRLTQARKNAATARMRGAKDAAKQRDGYRCRMPQCRYRGDDVHAMHIRHAGMGGDVTGKRSWKRSDYVTGCPAHHQLQHAGYLKMLAFAHGGDGAVLFYLRQSLHQPWTAETRYGITEPPREDAA